MRGKQTFDTLFEKEHVPAAAQAKGRSSEQITRRNRCLADRYYFYAHFKRKRYTDIMRQLGAEFFLSVHTIPDIIEQHVEYLLELKQLKPKPVYFSRLWPFMKW